MNSGKLGTWLSIVANIGLLVGLVLVAYEIRQNSQLARTTLMNDGNVVSNEIWANLMGQEPAATIAMASECPERMTYADFMAMDAFLFTSMNMLFRNYELAREGIFSQSEWKESVNAYAGWYLANPFGRAWWEEEARQFFAEEFAQHVDTQLQRNVRDSKSYWSGIRVRLLGTESASAGVVSPACSRQSLGSR